MSVTIAVGTGMLVTIAVGISDLPKSSVENNLDVVVSGRVVEVVVGTLVSQTQQPISSIVCSEVSQSQTGQSVPESVEDGSEVEALPSHAAGVAAFSLFDQHAAQSVPRPLGYAGVGS